MTAAECVMCARVAGEGPLFIADLGTSRAYLNEDQFFPGWVFVVLTRHAVELYDLEARWPVWRVPHDPKPLPSDEVARRIALIRAALA